MAANIHTQANMRATIFLETSKLDVWQTTDSVVPSQHAGKQQKKSLPEDTDQRRATIPVDHRRELDVSR